ncbi:EAL domain-containing protein [Dyella subtropica]|uniref:EAL domain-containing protein n=1 Tax=Dyella subtropica TaxID=2992127 RepID=UPI0022543710|nr:EAL domain-containing protein [Dyella subtropica]
MLLSFVLVVAAMLGLSILTTGILSSARTFAGGGSHVRHIDDVHRAISIGVNADDGLAAVVALASDMHARASRGNHEVSWIEDGGRAFRIANDGLPPLAFAFADALSEGSRDMVWLLGGLFALGTAWYTRRLLADRARATNAWRASEDRFQLAVAGSNDGLWSWDRDSGGIYLSPRLQQMLAVEGEPIAGDAEAIFGRLHPDDRHAAKRAVIAHIRRAEPLDVEFRIRPTDGEVRWFHASGQSVRDDLGVSMRMAGSVTEITERHFADAKLFAEKERTQVTLQSIGDAVITTDAHNNIEYLNPVAERLTRWQVDSARGRPVSDVCRIIKESNHEAIPDPATRVMHEQSGWRSRDRLLLQRNDGKRIAVDLIVSPVRDRLGSMEGAVLVMRDLSAEREHAALLRYQAAHDVLTGLINRREFERQLERAVVSAEEGSVPFTVLYIDLDQFKLVNDMCGRSAGDELLRQAAGLFKKKVRHSDTVARLGGDEFVVLLNNCAAEQGLQVAESLRASIGELRFVFDDRALRLSASIGLVSPPGDKAGAAEILRAADAACHVAKDKGRNLVQTYRQNDDDIAARQLEMSWISRIQDALAKERFALYAQDIVATNNDSLGRHVELLLRMVAENGELILPRTFIPAAERYGLMPAIDQWVVQAAFSSLRELRHSDPASLPEWVAINLSGASLCKDGFSDFLRRQLTAFDIPPSSVCFEITETTAISNLTRATAFMVEMRALGCRFALDDFGVGMSSFTYLKHLPVDFVKIDAGFVEDMIKDPIDYAMVEAINKIGHITGKLTVAEGVSSTELLDEVRKLGVDFAQGFAIALPLEFAAYRAGRILIKNVR